MLFILFLLFPLSLFAQVYLMSNYPLRNNNLQKVINLENYREMVQMIKAVEDVKEVYLMEEENSVYIYVERYPILKSIKVRGNRALIREEILSYLGLYEGMPLRPPEPESSDLEERVRRLYMDKGFLDVVVGVTLSRDEEGYVELYVGIEEGPVYFTEGGVYKGSSYEPSLLDTKIGLVRGRVVRESLFKELVFPLQDFYIKEGFWDVFVYYEGVEKLRLNTPFYIVLAPQRRGVSKKPLGFLGALSEGLSNLFSHPFGTLAALSGRGFVARPVFQVIEGKKHRILTEGVSFFKEKEIIELSGLQEKGVDPFSLEEAKESIMKAYRRKGFFEVLVKYRREGQDIVFTVEEGPRYRVLEGKPGEDFYDEDKLEATLREELEKLFRKGYTLAEGSISKEILWEEKRVRVSIDLKPGKRQILKDFVYGGDNREVRKIFSKHKEKLPTVFNTELVEALNLDIQRYFKEKGFLEGDYEVQVNIEEEKDSLYYIYIYRITEGPLYRYGETVYYGYDKTSTRELSYMTDKGKHYSEILDERTLHNMLSSGLFSGVSVETFADKEKKVVHRLVKVSEDLRGIFDVSLGYNTEENLSLEVFLGAKNLLGVGLTSGAKYRRTGKRELYDLILQDNFFFSSRYWFKLNFFRGYEEHKSYSLSSYGFNLQLGYRVGANTSVGPILSTLRNRVDGQVFQLRKQGLFLVREFKDDPFSPKRLHYNSLNLSLAEGDARYAKFDLSTFYVIPAKRDLKVSFKVAMGALWGDAPVFERFFLGGLRDLRGYSFEEVGQPRGGKYYGFGRLELLFPIREPFIGVVFGDSGAVGNSMKELLRGVKWSFGSALGVNTPIGPVRIDLAFPAEGDFYRKYKLYFSVGYYY
ncbi:MAG: BamA/TamA family outer membrane protein [Aquificaceae bacterium]|nr:BamA/TamA family outer membrane protein [Aquificaceae bacterium]MDW8424120.1 BamA/TamA family outer membrane protein [Aquificaceae bacterium]